MAKHVRAIIPVIIIWILAVFVFTGAYIVMNIESPEYTRENKSVFVEDMVYISDNYGKNGVVWKTDLKGKQQNTFLAKKSKLVNGWNITGLDTANENIYAVFERTVNDGGRDVDQYCVALMNEELEINYITPIFRFPMELNLTGFQSKEDVLYLTALSENGQQAYVYSVKTASMIEITDDIEESVDKWKEGKTTPVEIDKRESVWPRFFTEAEYRDGDFILRYDDNEPGYFEINDAAASVYSKAFPGPFSIMKATSFNATLPAMVAVIGIMVIIAIWLLLRNKRRVVYAIIIFELLLFLLVCGVVSCIAIKNRSNSEKEFVRFAVSDAGSVFDGYGYMDLTSAKLYDTDDYSVISDRIRRRVGTDGAGSNIEDMLVTDVLSGNVIMSASGHNMEQLSGVYGEAVADMLSDIGNGDEYSFKKVRIKGNEHAVLVTSLNSSGQQAYALVTVSDVNSLYRGIMTDFGGCVQYILVLFFVGSIAGIVLFLLQSRDIRKLQNALVDLARGEENIDKGVIIGRDINHMWNSLTEIRKNIVNTNRIKFLTYEAYFRFAPKSIERILKKQSITEIKCGDVITASGELAILSVPGKKGSGTAEVSRKSELLNVTEECRENYDGILISHDNELSCMKYLFSGDNKDSISFGIELMQKLREDKGRGFNKASMLLHYAPYVYGVAGDDKQAAVYFSSEEAEKLWAYADWFRELRFALIVTGELLEREGLMGDYRYIGFIIPDETHPERKLKLYEALDAELPAVRSRRVRQKERFNDALELFYKKDFYIARGAFSEILRESPDDELTKWYLFECEKHLDGVAGQDFTGALHMN